MPQFETFLCYEMKLAMKKIERYMTRRLEEYGLNFSQSLVLFCLMEQNGQTLSEVGNMAQIENSTLTSMSDKLERMGLVEKRADTKNRRVVKLFITTSGKAIGQEVLSLGAHFNNQLQEKLGELQGPMQRSLRLIGEAVDDEAAGCSGEEDNLRPPIGPDLNGRCP